MRERESEESESCTAPGDIGSSEWAAGRVFCVGYFVLHHLCLTHLGTAL